MLITRDHTYTPCYSCPKCNCINLAKSTLSVGCGPESCCVILKLSNLAIRLSSLSCRGFRLSASLQVCTSCTSSPCGSGKAHQSRIRDLSYYVCVHVRMCACMYVCGQSGILFFRSAHMFASLCPLFTPDACTVSVYLASLAE